MSTLSPASLSLVSMPGVFLETALACVTAFFGRPCDRSGEWGVVDRLDSSFDLIITIGCANKAYQGILAVGIDHASMAHFVGETVTVFEARDIFGEFANNYCAMLMDQPQFNARFGILHQSLPVLYSNGQPFLPFISGIQGTVLLGSGSIHIGFAVQKNGSNTV